jgi:hypothetical protein
LVKKLDGLPEQFTKAYPYKDRPRSDDLYGVTEVLYCARKSYLSRVVPAPTAVEFEVRRRFARGHAMESVFFGDHHNPIYVKGIGPFAAMEGHADHAVQDDSGNVKEIVEFKSVKKLWFTAPSGKVYFSPSAAKKVVDKEDWDKIERRYSENHMDQLMIYMILTNAEKGYLIYYEMSTDDNHAWEIDQADISQEFKDKMLGRLNYLKECFDKKNIPLKTTMYPWECSLCSFNRNGICGLCEKNDFDFNGFIKDVLAVEPDKFMDAVEKYTKKFGVTPGEVAVFPKKET